MKREFNYREIPYNYTSYSDKEIILKYFDEETWQILDNLRSQRVTGRSAKLLFDLIGDIFIIDRNPYIQDDFLNSQDKIHRLKRLHRLRLATIRKGSNSREVNTIIDRTEQLDQEFFHSFSEEEKDRRRILRVMGGVTDKKNISFSAFHRVMHVTDATDWRVEYPKVVVYPQSVTEIPGIITASAGLGLSIIPRGGGTGLTGGAIPINKKTVVINTEKLRAISPITHVKAGNHEIPIVTVEAGVITENVMKQCKDQGFIFATDPTSAWASTIGGNIAENCGGKKAVMWGTAIDNIYSYRMVMPDGSQKEIQRRDHPYRKIAPEDTVIFDLYLLGKKGTRTLEGTVTLRGTEIRKPGVGKDITNKALNGLPGIQKEGGDGIIVSASFVLYRPFNFRKTLCLEFYGNSMTNASKAIVRILDRFKNDSSSYLTALEHWDDKYGEAINYRNKSERSEKPKAVLLIDIESNDENQLDAASRDVMELLHEYNTEGFIAHDEKSHVAFWLDRKNLGAIARHTNAFKLNEDVVIPIESLPGFADFIDLVNIEKEIGNNLTAIDAVSDYLGELHGHDEDPFLKSKIELFRGKIGELRERYQSYLSGMNKPLADNGGETVFSLLREKKVSVSLADDMILPFCEAFSGYEEVITQFKTIADAIRGKKIIIATHMHAGDGNIHVNIPVHSNDYRMMIEADETAGVIMRKTVELGGVISGEHGIGLTKLRYIGDDVLDAYAAYKKLADPGNLFNPGKLDRNFQLHMIYTPSLNLLKKEAFILETADLKDLTSSISACVRCGKCKEVCNTQFARGDMHYSPRNKILGVSLITEAVLYESQTSSSVNFKNFTMLRDIANNCTMCHQCYKPCPVNIDFGDVTLDIRKLLVERKHSSSKPVTELTLFYLKRKGYRVNQFFRIALLKFAFSAQRIAYHVNRPIAGLTAALFPFIAAMLSGKMRKSGAVTIREALKLKGTNTFYSFTNPNKEIHSSVIYFPGCGSERMFSEISFAVCALMYQAGVRVVIPPEYMCCGYPILANGKARQAEMKSFENRVIFHRMAETIGYMEISDVMVSCGTCHEMLGKYQLGTIFPGASIRDVNEYIAEHNLYSTQKTRDILYHDPCHSPLKNFGYSRAFEKILNSRPQNIPNCCGEGGTLALSTPSIAQQLRGRKKRNIRAVAGTPSAEILTTCPSCVQGLSRIQSEIAVEGKSMAVYLAEEFLGKRWKTDFIRAMKKPGSLERIIY